MIKIALTGGIGCGKSLACEFFSQLNTPIIDTDIISRELVKPNQTALIEIVEYFGADVLLKNGTLNRKVLATKIFNHKKNKLALETILHPKIRQVVQSKLNKLDCCYVIIAIPLLVETHQQNNFDRVLLIDCDEKLQISRTLSRDKRDLHEIKSIIKSQASRQERLTVADDIINNSTDISDFEKNLIQLHSLYMEMC